MAITCEASASVRRWSNRDDCAGVEPLIDGLVYRCERSGLLGLKPFPCFRLKPCLSRTFLSLQLCDLVLDGCQHLRTFRETRLDGTTLSRTLGNDSSLI